MYNFTKKNLLENPEKYFYTSFLGRKFISYYFDDREKKLIFLKDKIIKNQNNLKISSIKSYINKFHVSLRQNSLEIDTQSFLLNILNEKEFNDHYFDLILNRFEVTKKIYLKYSKQKFKGHGVHNKLLVYLFFGFVLSEKYSNSKNLVYLNSLIKIVDIISSQKKINGINELTGSVLLIEKELYHINALMKNNNL